MKESTTRIYNWATVKASSSRAPLWLAVLFTLELVLFMPLDAILIFFCLQRPRNILLYVLLATLASTISGLAGYLVGHFLWDLIGGWVVPHLISTSFFEKLAGHFQMYESWAVFFGALLPLPLKALSVAAGVFNLGIGPFITYMAIARFLRFSLIGAAMAFWGEKVKVFLDKHFHRLFVLIGAKVALVSIFLWALAR